MLTYAKRKISNPCGMQSVHRDPFRRCNRHPMCSFILGDSHARADIYAWNPHVQLPALLNKQAVTYTEPMVDNPRGMLPTHLDAFERRDRLPLCSFVWGTAMHGQKHVHETPMYDYLHYWSPTNSCKLKLNMWQTTCRVRQLCKYIDVKGGIHSQCVVSCGGQPCMGRHLCLEHPCVAVPPFEKQRTGGDSC